MFNPRRIGLVWGLGGLLLMAAGALLAAEPPTKGGYREALERQQHLAEQKQLSVIPGRPGIGDAPTWLFFTPEIRAVLSPPFWGDKAVAVSRSSNPKYADPLAPILDFHSQLKSAGIELWIAPVPAKVAVYPQQCVADGILPSKERIDRSHEEFYRLLQTQGVTVVDLTAPFREPKWDDGAWQSRLFCATDSHWSGAGVQLAAATFAPRIKTLDWYPSVAKTKFQTEPYATEITGDLAKLLNEKNPVREKLALTRVFHTVEGKSLPVADDPQSPILLLGDSHTLIFHDPTLYAEGCGLADHLAEQLGIRLDVIGVRGSGANAARLNWRRRAEPLAGKKLVIWCFSMREFTENTDGWRVIPMTKR